VRVHLVDGTYELFRYYFALPGHLDDDGIEVDAVRGVLGSTLALLEEGATHIGVATDHVIESFRNDMWPGYKTSAGIEPELLAQFPLLEDALRALGVTPESIPDWLALVGDSSDGFPGLKGWGAKSASAVLLRYRHLEDIPHDHWRWDVDVRGATRLAASLNEQQELAHLFRDLATLRAEPAPFADVDELRWAGPAPAFEAIAERLDRPNLVDRAQAIAKRSMTA